MFYIFCVFLGLAVDLPMSFKVILASLDGIIRALFGFKYCLDWFFCPKFEVSDLEIRIQAKS